MSPPFSHARDFEHIVMSNFLEIRKLGIIAKGQNQGQGESPQAQAQELKNSVQFVLPKNAEREPVQDAVTTGYLNNGKLHNVNDISNDEVIADKSSFCSNRKWWWDPPKESVPKEFFMESSMHGLKFLAQPKLHVFERVFWLIAFFIGVTAAGLLINDVWERYNRVPVIVSFLPVEMDIEFIPFPALTICNMNPIPKSEVDEILRVTLRSPDDPDYNETELNEAEGDLKYLRNLCDFQQSFANNFGFAAKRGKVNVSDDEYDSNFIPEQTQGPIDEEIEKFLSFIKRRTVPCHEMVRLCMWAGKTEQKCSHYFKPILTEYGNCCTFNMLPPELLYTNANAYQDQKQDHNDPGWSDKDIKAWKRWNYNKNGFIITEAENITFPRRQITPGLPYGLSILLDANIDDYFCPSSDSEGFRFTLHTAVEAPQIIDHGLSIGLGKEVFMDLSVDLTMADPEVDNFEFTKRQCYFGYEKTLGFYQPYTTTNCIEECITKHIIAACNCSFFYMPRDESTRFCVTHRDGDDFKCVAKAKKSVISKLTKVCRDCDSLCMDVSYRFQSTTSELQNISQLWAEPDADTVRNNHTKPPEWANHKMSVMHLFFASGSTTPKIRKALYGPTELIANTGGILGLCLGFSVLSAVEVLYFFTCRIFFSRIRRKTITRRIVNKFKHILQKHKKTIAGLEQGKGQVQSKSKDRIITLDKDDLKFYPAYHKHSE